MTATMTNQNHSSSCQGLPEELASKDLGTAPCFPSSLPSLEIMLF